MKYLSTILSVLLLMVGLTYAQDTSTTSNTPPTQETINEELVSILGGVKKAGGEIYKASKEMIIKGVNFIQEQTPEVIHQFLVWKIIESSIPYAGWLASAIILFYVSYRASKWWNKLTDSEKRDAWRETPAPLVPWGARILGMIVVLISTATYLPDILKIYITPKVYLLEYMVSMCHK